MLGLTIVFLLLHCDNEINRTVNEKLMDKKSYSNSEAQKVSTGCKIGELAKSSKIPNSQLLQAIQTKDLVLFKENIDENLGRSFDFNSNEEFFAYWKVENGNSSTFWLYFENLMTHGGFYKNDSTYIMPLYTSLVDTFNYDCDFKLYTIRETIVYEKPNFLSKKMIEVGKFLLLTFDGNKTKTSIDVYESLNYPTIDEFNEGTWYYIPKYRGFINNLDVWNINESSELYLTKKNDKWLLSLISQNN
jgi:hypothetical protein